MKVEIRSYYRDHVNGDLCYTWTLGANGRAVCSNASVQEEVEHDGIFGRHGRLYYPKDGEDFLRNLPYDYAGSSFIRGVIIE